MLKLIKYLKSSVASILIIVVLLVGQAACDLTLPQYTSNIVNVGIQQGGVENAAPTVIRVSEMNKLFLFMSQADQDTVLQSYKKLDKADMTAADADKALKKYPQLAKEPLYERTAKDDETIDALSRLLSKPMLVVMGFSGDNEEMGAMANQMLSSLPPQMAGKDVFDVLAMMTDEQRSQMITAINDKMKEMPDSILEQSAVVFVKQEYQAVGIDTDKLQNNYVLLTGAKMLGLALLSMLLTVLVGFIASRVAASLGKELRGRVFRKVVSFSHAELDRFSTASLITRSTNDIQQIQMLFVMLLRIVFYAPIIGIGGVIKVLNTNTSMAWIIAVAVMAVLTLVIVLFAVAMPRFKIMQKLVDKVNLVTREILTGLPVIRAFSTQKHEEERFDKANKDLTRTNLFVNRVMTTMMPMMMLIMNGITVLIMWNGAHGVDVGSMQVGDLMAFMQYTMQIVMAFLMISMFSIMLPRASVSAGRIEEVLQTEPVIRDPEQTVSFDDAKRGLVEFKNVSFRYPGAEENVLENISFTAKPGETTAFIGSTGSGKSTLINLIPRFYDITEGELLVDGADVRRVSQHDLRAKIGYVPQKGVLFSGTIASNLRYGNNDASQEELDKAAQIAQAADFIGEKPDGFDSEISQGGTNVSGGQKQRLSIARAIAIHPEIYIFDDSFSALDYKTDVALRKALKEETAGSTVLIVAQRISTILHAEQIIVLDEGKIVGKGTHKELLKTCEVYQQIAMSQLSKEELGNE
ncbi:MAG: ABC transporter ATP-binding protein [Oscillospiraceae bacterium]|nr:ABC transporter ATP-binding protein [Oscillospiraceae bacterium]